MSELRALDPRRPAETADEAPAVPFSIEAEQQLLGTLLTNNDVFDQVTRLVRGEHFYDPVHRRIFELCSERIVRNALASPVTIKAFMEHDAGLKELGGPAYLARLAGAVLTEYAAVLRKLPQAKPHTAAYADLQAQLGALMPKWFIRDTPYAQLAHFPRYLKAVQARIDKLRADPARDARLVGEMAPLLTQYQRARAALKGAPDPRLDEFRWLLEELRVALYAQELRTPMPVSVKRLMKSWESLQR